MAVLFPEIIDPRERENLYRLLDHWCDEYLTAAYVACRPTSPAPDPRALSILTAANECARLALEVIGVYS